MSTAQVSSEASENASVKNVDMKLEVVTIPVSDMDRATEFYVGLGWRQDVTPPGSGIVQLTPPGSGCSVQFGTNRTSAEPGSAQNTFLIVTDIEAAYDYLVGRGIQVSGVFHLGPDGPVSGAAPEHASYGSLATFSDPDGNTWLFQEITTRLPGRGLSNLDVSTLTELLRETEQHHGEYEPTAPKHHWSGWYAAYIVARQDGKTPEEAAKLGKLHIEGTR